MKTTKTLPFVSLILIATMIGAPFIFAIEGGSFGGFDGSGFSGGSFGGTDTSGFSGGSFGGTDPSGFSGGSFGGFDPSGFSGGSYGGSDSGAFSGGSTTGSTGSSGPGSIDGGSTGGSFDGGSSGFPGDFPGGPTPGPGPGFPSEHDAVWQDLSDVTILRGSPSGTLIQEDVFSKCSDPDSEELFFEIASTSAHYELFFFSDDIRIFDLDPGFTGSEEVVVTCNGVPESFILNVVAPGTPAPTPEDDEGDGLSVHIGAIIIPNAYDAMAGDTIPVTISFKNNGDEELENLKAAVAIPDLGVRASVGPLDLKVGKRISKTVYIELPEDAQAGLYYARITIDSGSLHRVKHRDVELIVQ
jgi:hypothetical protein